MEAARCYRVGQLFHQALDRPAALRDAFLRVPALDVVAADAPPSAEAPLPEARAIGAGDRIAHYRVLRKSGEGGMGVVFEAEDDQLGRRVALKVLRHDGADPKARERLVREARVVASVVHPLICQVYALGTLGSSPFIAIELVEGESLAERLARGPRRPRRA